MINLDSSDSGLESRTIGGYKFERKNLIGKGAFSTVYLGYLESDPKQVFAIKRIKFNPNKSIERQRQLIQREYEINQRLNHPNIVKFYAYLDDPSYDCYKYLVFEYCNGPDLETLLFAEKGMKEDQAIFLFGQILEGFSVI